ncbi:MAG: SHOCT-like domain-containing protein [Caldisericaceae bacterium]
MNEELNKVLDLLEQGKITKEEASELIEALKVSENQKKSPPYNKRFVRITVTEEGKDKVNITMPIGVINFGLSALKLTGSRTMNLGGESIPIDIEELKKAISDPNFTGKVIDVDEGSEGEHVEIEII